MQIKTGSCHFHSVSQAQIHFLEEVFAKLTKNLTWALPEWLINLTYGFEDREIS